MGGPALIDGYVLSCTDNFHQCPFLINSLQYHSSQGYFQASKAKSQLDHNRIRHKQSGMQAWSEGSKVEIREDWEVVKVRKMLEGVRQKFKQNQEIGKQLVETKGEFRFNEGFWGRWNGWILERVRAELRGGEGDKYKVEEIEAKMREYQKEQEEILKYKNKE